MTAEAWQATRPPLTRDNELALDVWRFCEGWHPERVPIAAAYYGITDLDTLMAQLMLIRDRVAAHESARRAARG